jgi:hypothetical protein
LWVATGLGGYYQGVRPRDDPACNYLAICPGKKRYFVLLFGVLSVFQVLNVSHHPVNVHWLLFTVGTFIFFKSHKQ